MIAGYGNRIYRQMINLHIVQSLKGSNNAEQSTQNIMEGEGMATFLVDFE